MTLLQRFDRLFRFGLVGIAVSLLHTGLTTALYLGRVFTDPTLASAVAFVLALPVSYLAHRHITYPDTQARGTHGRFGVIGLSSFVIATGTMKAMDSQGWPFWIALAAGWVLIPAVNYFINALWVFRVSSSFALEKQLSRNRP